MRFTSLTRDPRGICAEIRKLKILEVFESAVGKEDNVVDSELASFPAAEHRVVEPCPLKAPLSVGRDNDRGESSVADRKGL